MRTITRHGVKLQREALGKGWHGIIEGRPILFRNDEVIYRSRHMIYKWWAHKPNGGVVIGRTLTECVEKAKKELEKR